MPVVSIVIICMNNLKNLYPCLNSIRKYTTVSYETFVVAYLFTPENLAKAKEEFPWVTFVESNEIRGFSENNNLALHQAKGKYCFVVNDDTEMKEPVVDKLVFSIQSLPENVAVISPVLRRWDGSIQYCGRPEINLKTWFLSTIHLWNERKTSRYVNQQGVFRSFNLVGAAFLIKTNVFEKMGWFDEKYFFCPEDVALSTKLNESGYYCYVDANVSIIHYEGMSGKSLSKIQTATRPAARKGTLLFLARNSNFLYVFLCFYSFLITFVHLLIHATKAFFTKRPNAYSIMTKGDFNILMTSFSSKSPKEIFTRYFKKNK